MFDWVPVVFATFKGLIFVTCMFFAIKWHYDQSKKKGANTRVLLGNTAKVLGAFILGVVVVLGLTFGLATSLGMDLNL